MRGKKKKSLRSKIVITLLILAVLAGGAFGFYTYTNPQITLKGDKTMEVTMKDGYQEPGAEASFAFHDISSHIQIQSHVNDKKVGTYTVTVTANVAHVDPAQCVACGTCAESCPKHVIEMLTFNGCAVK